MSRLQDLYAIDAREGANRPGLSAAEQRAHDLVAGWMSEAGLEVSIDPAGNLVGRLPGTDPAHPEVWTGSHLDTVPNGGRFDGALGVVAGLEALARIASDGGCQHTLAVVAFRDEEGWRFGEGFFGSRALCGQLAPGELEIADAEGITIAAALSALGLEPAVPEGGRLPESYVELHLEQGTTLATRGVPVGVVSEIVAMGGMTVDFSGARAHAGGTAMSDRHDALLAASRFVVGAFALAASEESWRATVGDLRVHDGASNVVPEAVTAVVDVRARTDQTLSACTARLEELAHEAAAQSACSGEVRLAWRRDAVAMDPEVSAALAEATGVGGDEVVSVPSWAGHDAGVLAGAGVRVGMLFVRAGAGGVSHSPLEVVDESDVVAGVEVLANSLAELAGEAKTA